jgi:hypothetical protein
MLEKAKAEREADPVTIRMATVQQAGDSSHVTVQMVNAPFAYDDEPKTVVFPKILDKLVPRFFATTLRMNEAVAIGRALGLVAFASIPARELIRHVQAADRPRRFVLKFKRHDTRLIMLPWEMLRTDFDADDASASLMDGTADVELPSFMQAHDTSYLALLKGVSIVRTLEQLDRVRHEQNLRGAFAVFSNPAGTQSLGLAEEKSALANLLEQSERELQLGLARRSDFPAELQTAGKARLKLLHFSGHGKVGPSHEGGSAVLMEDVPDGEPVSAKDLALFFKNAQMSIAVLNACETACASDNVAYGPAIGTSLFEQGVAAVVAMQSRIYSSAGKLFARNFYSSLVAGASIDNSLNDARLQMFYGLKKDARVQAFSPVLYRHYEDPVFADVPPPADFDNGVKIHEDRRRVTSQRKGLLFRMLTLFGFAAAMAALPFASGTGALYGYIVNMSWGVLLTGSVATALVVDAYWRLRARLLASTAARLHDLELTLKTEVGRAAESPEDASSWIRECGKHRALVREWNRATRVKSLLLKLVPSTQFINESQPTNREVAETIVGHGKVIGESAYD